MKNQDLIKMLKDFLSLKKYQPHRLGIIFLILGIILAGLFQNEIGTFYTKLKYHNYPLTITLLTLERDNSKDYMNLTNWNFKEVPIMLELMGRNYTTDSSDLSHLLSIENFNRINTSGDKVIDMGNYCLFSSFLQLKAKKFERKIVGYSFDFEGVKCNDCIEQTITISNFGDKPINNFFARICIEGIIKEVSGDYFHEDGIHCIEIKKPRLDFGEHLYGKTSILDYYNKSILVDFKAFSDEQKEITDYNFIHMVGLLKSNCEVKNATFKTCFRSGWLSETIYPCK